MSSTRCFFRPRPVASRWCCLRLAFVCCVWTGAANADDALLAVASNFLSTAQSIQATLARETTHRIRLASGSSGMLFAQASLGAPYDGFIAADQTYLDRLQSEGQVVQKSRFTYAFGRLALVSRERATLEYAALSDESEISGRVALPNPELAPYGMAAEEALSPLGLRERSNLRSVFGENVSQTYAMVVSGNAQLGIVALSVVLDAPERHQLPYRVVPAEWHSPIRQDAALLKHGENNSAAQMFLDFLGSERGRQLLAERGFDLP